jgi:hypothetical protein
VKGWNQNKNKIEGLKFIIAKGLEKKRQIKCIVVVKTHGTSRWIVKETMKIYLVLVYSVII